MPTTPVYARSAVVSVPAGLDPERFRATLLVERVDGRPLNKTDRDQLAAALASTPAPEAVPAKPKGKAPRKATSTASKGRKASKAPARKAARRKA